MTWTGCETVEDVHSDCYGSATGLLLVLSVKMVYIYYISCLRYTILVGNSWICNVCVLGRLKEVSMTWTGCETIEDDRSDYYGSATGLVLVVSVSDRHRPYTLHMAINSVPRRAKKELEIHMFNPYLGL